VFNVFYGTGTVCTKIISHALYSRRQVAFMNEFYTVQRMCNTWKMLSKF
jgi:hypothetical protein